MLRRTEIPKMSAKKRTELAEAGVVPFSTFKPKPGKALKLKRDTDTGPDKNTVEVVLERDGFQCVVCGGGLFGRRGMDYSAHHRKLRSQGGDNRLSNLISVCGHGTVGCHGDIHGAPAKAADAGWIVSREHDPAQTLMAHSLYGWVLLPDDGSVSHRAGGETQS